MTPRVCAATAYGNTVTRKIIRDGTKRAVTVIRCPPYLKTDLENLQRDHAIDDSLIGSLLASPEQAKEHIAFWTRIMWVSNGVTILVFAVGLGLSLRKIQLGAPLWWMFGVVIGFLGFIWAVGVLRRQGAAIQAVKKVADRHGLT